MYNTKLMSWVLANAIVLLSFGANVKAERTSSDANSYVNEGEFPPAD